MFKYSPNDEILEELRKIRKLQVTLNREYKFIMGHVGDSYDAYVAFWKQYDGFVLYSPVRLKEIPLQGVLLPMKLFKEEIVHD